MTTTNDNPNVDTSAVQARIDVRWRSMNYSPLFAWDPIIVELDRKLADIDPDYTISQVKEKFGSLRFYYQASFDLNEESRKEMDRLVVEAEKACAKLERES